MIITSAKCSLFKAFRRASVFSPTRPKVIGQNGLFTLIQPVTRQRAQLAELHRDLSGLFRVHLRHHRGQLAFLHTLGHFQQGIHLKILENTRRILRLHVFVNLDQAFHLGFLLLVEDLDSVVDLALQVFQLGDFAGLRFCQQV